MKLVIVESPTKAKTINKYLGKDFNVIASFGHIRDLPSKNGSVIPDEDFKMMYEISSKSASHVKAICESAKKADSIYLATDPDREGEAISWHIIEALKEKKAIKSDMTIKRVVFSEITKRSVSEAMSSPRDIDMNLVDAQQARRALDYLVGFTLSPVLWRKLPGSKSAGRVQSVALRMICDREHEIERFITQEYWDISLDMLSFNKERFKARLTHIDGTKLDKFSIRDEEASNNIVKKLEKSNYVITSIDKKQQRRHPQPPFTTSSLQQEASRKLGFSAKKTMQIAQKLYEGVDIGGETTGLITYMRTDGVSLSADAVNETRQWIISNFGKNYLPEAIRVYKAKAKNAQEAHEAIRPTDINKTPDSLSNILDKDQHKLYELIWKRMIACQTESVVMDIVTAIIDATDSLSTLRAVGSSIVFDGFYKIYREDTDENVSEESTILPILNEGEEVKVSKILPEQHFTEPPPRYTEASLVKKLEELGIGRPSTYATIISVLQERDYVTLDKKGFIPEERGMLVTAFLVNSFPKYVEYDFTADLENELDEVAEGKIIWKHLLRNFWEGFSAKISEVSNYKISDVISQLEDTLSDHLFKKNNDEDPRQCKSCNTGRLGLKLGKYGAFIACSNYPECKFTKQIAQADNSNESSVDENEANKLIGKDASGTEIYLKKGPYGHYLQVGEVSSKKDKPQRCSIPSMININDINLSIALNLLSLPKVVGQHSDTQEGIMVGIGKFGPYIKYAGKFISIPKGEDFLNVSLERAMEILKNSNKTKK